MSLQKNAFVRIIFMIKRFNLLHIIDIKHGLFVVRDDNQRFLKITQGREVNLGSLGFIYFPSQATFKTTRPLRTPNNSPTLAMIRKINHHQFQSPT